MDCVEGEVRVEILKLAMQGAKVPAAMQQRVLAEADQLYFFRGIVEDVITQATTTDVRVKGLLSERNQSSQGYLTLSFPPNAASFETELKRAQNEDRWLNMVYRRPSATAPVTIETLHVFASLAATATLNKAIMTSLGVGSS